METKEKQKIFHSKIQLKLTLMVIKNKMKTTKY
jgi:hypothetical protein